MVQSEYTVRVEDFEGPLDLLLFLVRRAEVDIEYISIADITDQFVRHMERVDRIDVESAGEFLVVAATLLELKSRLVGGGADDQGGEGSRASLGAVAGDAEDPASDLIRQLLRYKAFRDAADALEGRREEWLRRYPSGKASADLSVLKAEQQDESAFVEDLDVLDLVRAFRRIAETVVFDRLGEHEVAYDDTPIELHAQDIVDQLERDASTMPLRRVFEGRNRSEMIGLFLALLELVRQRRVRVTQPAPAEEIVMRLTTEDERREAEERESGQSAVAAPATAEWDDDHILDDEEIDDDDDDDLMEPS